MGYGYPGYGYGGYPGSVVIINNYGEAARPTAYGKRATRSGMVTTPQEGGNYRTRTNYVATSSGDRPTSTGGRVSSPTKSTQQPDYYNRTWRNSQQNEYSSPSRSSANNQWDNSYNRSSNSDSYNRSSNTNSSFSSPSRTDSYNSGGATRSSAPASSGSNGRTRGRD